MARKAPKDMIPGSIHKSNSYGKFTVVEYINSSKVVIEFIETGYTTAKSSTEIRCGQVKDKLLPSVCGVGFVGVGCHECYVGRISTRQYRVWINMISRCYDEKTMLKHPTYRDCSVCKEWHNFQNFAEWYNCNYPLDGKSYDLDKDIKIEGNRVYSPESCLFVTPKENTRFSLSKAYEFKNPSGEVVKTHSLTEFCIANNLNRSHMVSVSTGNRKHHKGYVLHNLE